MRMKLKITADNLYHYLLILLLINNWWGDLRVFIGFYQIFKPFVLGLAFFLSLLLLFREKHSNTELIIIFFLIISGLYTTYVTDTPCTPNTHITDVLIPPTSFLRFPGISL